MRKIKKFFLTISMMATLLFIKVGNVFGMDSVALYGVPSPKYNDVPELYGVYDPNPIMSTEPAIGVADENIFGKIALFVLLPLCIIAIIVAGIVALVKVNKKKKQANSNMNQNINNNNNGNVQ